MYINFDSVSSQRRMNEENLAKQEESVRKQEAMKRGSLVAFHLSLHIVPDLCGCGGQLFP